MIKRYLLIAMLGTTIVLSASRSAAAGDDAPETEWVALDDLSPPKGLTADQRTLYQEGVSLLKPRCEQTKDSNSCHSFADQFAREYVNAVAGDYTAQADEAFAFLADFVVPRNYVSACAMRQMMAASRDRRYDHTQKALTISDCWEHDDVTPEAQIQASKLEHYQAAHHVKRIAVPGLDFDPATQSEEDPPS